MEILVQYRLKRIKVISPKCFYWQNTLILRGRLYPLQRDRSMEIGNTGKSCT